MSANRIANRYAKALFNLCDGDLKVAKKYLTEFEVILRPERLGATRCARFAFKQKRSVRRRFPLVQRG